MTGSGAMDACIAEAVRRCESVNSRWLEWMNRGTITAEELLRYRSSAYAEILNGTLRELHRICEENCIPWSDEEWDRVRRTLAKAAGLRLVPTEYRVPDPGFDRLADGSVQVFRNRLIGFDDLLHTPSPIGRTFCMKLLLDHRGERVEAAYRFTVDAVEAGEGRWKGGTCWKGSGSFPGYRGEGRICIAAQDGASVSAVWQKCYIDPDDDVWKRFLPDTAAGEQLDNIEEQYAATRH